MYNATILLYLPSYVILTQSILEHFLEHFHHPKKEILYSLEVTLSSYQGLEIGEIGKMLV